jgi:hypothetical protein
MATISEKLLGVLGVYLQLNFQYGMVIYTIVSLALISWQRNGLDTDKDKQCFNKYTNGNGVIMFLLICALLVPIIEYYFKNTAQGWVNTWYGNV